MLPYSPTRRTVEPTFPETARTRMTRRGATVVSLWLVALPAMVVMASGAVSPTPAIAQTTSSAAARALFAQGNRLFAASQRSTGARRRELAERALAAYVQSLGLVRSRNALYNAAMVLIALERPTEAYAYLTEYLDDPEVTDVERADAAARRDALLESIAIARIDSEPQGAEVTLEAPTPVPLGRTPLEVPLPAGEHRLRIEAPHHEVGHTALSLQTGERVERVFRLEPRPIPVMISVVGAEPAEAGALALSVDGALVAAGQEVFLAPGEHALSLTHEDGRSVVETLELSPGDSPTVVTLELPPPEPPTRTSPDPMEDHPPELDLERPPSLTASLAPSESSESPASGRRARLAGLSLMGTGAALGLGAFALRLRSGRLNERHDGLATPSPDAATIERARAIARKIDRVNGWGRAITAVATVAAGVGFVLVLRGRALRRSEREEPTARHPRGGSARLRIAGSYAELIVDFDRWSGL